MKVKLLVLAGRFPEKVKAGSIVEVDAGTGKELIENGFAEPAEKGK